MKDVKVSELRQRLPEYLAKVRHGERLRVTSRGKVIAEIAPPAPRRTRPPRRGRGCAAACCVTTIRSNR